MTQMPFPTNKKIAHYGGYSFGFVDKATHRGALPYVSAVVTVPRYARKVRSEIPTSIPVVLDNGAFPAFVKGLSPPDYPLATVLSNMSRARKQLKNHRIKWAILPDVVADPNETWARLSEAVFGPFWEFEKDQSIVPVQEGMDLQDVVEFTREFAAGVLIGGKERSWKFQVAEEIKRMAPDIHVHIARISSEDHLQYACLVGADSFDTTTYYYGMGNAPGINFGPRLKRYCTPRPLSDLEKIDLMSYR